jgi:ring-1,2-phenylacetyl-CoA epoxidase subunit PaaE
VLSREDLGLPLFSGRLDSARLEALFDSLVDPSTVDEWFLCGPFDMVQTARAVLSALGVEGSLIHDELFFAGPIDAAALPPEPEAGEGTVTVELVLEGRRSTTRMLPGTSILDAALRVRRELPYSCKGGMCASCKARLVEGEARMDKNYALIDREVEAGFILTCQAHPVSDRVVVDFDRR